MSYEEVDQSALSISVLTLLLSRCRVNPGAYWQCLSAQQCFSFADEYVCTPVVGGAVERILGKWRLLIIWLSPASLVG